MDPVTIALLARAATASALAVRDIFNDNALSAEQKEAKVVELLASIKENLAKSYEDYDPTLDEDLIAAGLANS